MTIHEILKTYWGYDSFRPLQEEIVRSVLDGHDTLALLPTGGGKSLCFQVPAMAMEGLCVVVSPLIALMKDQVENLEKRGIEAAALYSGMSFKQMELVMSKARFGNLKFLYVSPERLAGTWLREHLQHCTICLLAVDEAHCISQWGHDFRPEYLRIAEIREQIPGIRMLALTASATEKVTEDLLQRLHFKDGRLFRKSFERENLSYVVLYEENKRGKMIDIAKKVGGTGLVYVKNRRTARELSDYFNAQGLSTGYYHGGLPGQQRMSIQEDWIKNKLRLIVCTNAFGMGIDKPDVRFVLHYDIPESPEAYYQEAGRAGRDGKKAWCVLLFQPADEAELRKQAARNFPDTATIWRVYDALGNFFGLAPGSGQGLSFVFDIGTFVERFNLDINDTYNSLKILQRQGFLHLSENIDEPSRVRFLADHLQLYDFQLKSPRFEPLVKLMLRAYGGIYDNYTVIREADLARRLKTDEKTVADMLTALQQQGMLDYSPANDKPKITYLEPRAFPGRLLLDIQALHTARQNFVEKTEAMIAYAAGDGRCRSMKLLGYFNEDAAACGHCDVCLAQKKERLQKKDMQWFEEQIRTRLSTQPLSLEALVSEFGTARETEALDIIRFLMDNNHVLYNDQNLLTWQD